MKNAKTPKLSIVIPTFNTKKLLFDCLDSIYTNENTKALYEVVVVDSGTDDSSEMVLEKFKDAVLIRNKNKGFAHAVNVGWKKSKGELILFLNSDTVVKKPFIKAVVDYMETNPQVGCLSLKLMLRNGKIDQDTHRGLPTPWAAVSFFFFLENIFPNSKLFGQYHKAYLGRDTIHEIDAGAGASMIVPRSLLEKINGWDETYSFYGEDLDLCFRIQQAGYKIMFYPFVDILHYKGATSGLKRTSKDVARKVDKDELIKLTKSTIYAWEVFVKKFYKDRYPKPFVWFVLFGVRVKGWLRIFLFNLGFKI